MSISKLQKKFGDFKTPTKVSSFDLMYYLEIKEGINYWDVDISELNKLMIDNNLWYRRNDLYEFIIFQFDVSEELEKGFELSYVINNGRFSNWGINPVSAVLYGVSVKDILTSKFDYVGDVWDSSDDEVEEGIFYAWYEFGNSRLCSINSMVSMVLVFRDTSFKLIKEQSKGKIIKIKIKK